MTAPTKIEAALAVLDDQHDDFLRAGMYSGEGCWFYHLDAADYKTAYKQARATLAQHIAAQDAEIARLTAAQTPPRSEGVEAALTAPLAQGWVMVPMPAPNCRERLRVDGKPYPRSSCAVCGKFSPNSERCDRILSLAAAPPLTGVG